MQMAYDDKKLFYNSFLFVIEKFDFLVEMPPEREVLWFFSRVQTVEKLKTPKTEAPRVVLSKNMGGSSWHFHEGETPFGPHV